jgi:hypothetical protein
VVEGVTVSGGRPLILFGGVLTQVLGDSDTMSFERERELLFAAVSCLCSN